jgi:hypothetical protein
VGSLLLTGLAPTVTATANQTVRADTGQLTLTGLAPTVSSPGGAVVTDPYAYFPGDTFGTRGKRYEEYSEEHPEQPKPKKARKQKKKAEPTPLPPLPVPAPEPVTAVPVAQPVAIQSPPLVTYVAPPRRLWTLQPITASASASVTVGHARIEPWMLYDVLDPQEEADEEAIILALLR